MTYKQTKLFMSQVEAADETSRLITKIGDWSNTPEGDEYWRAIRIKLEDKARHGTNDGKPWVDPSPNVGRGYRVATLDDANRQDREYWTAAGYWTRLDYSDSQHLTGAHYRVPIDRVPTDDDAKDFPFVMVRECDDEAWIKRRLTAVGGTVRFYALSNDRSMIMAWKQARHLYPGE